MRVPFNVSFNYVKEGRVSRCGQIETRWTECIPFLHYGEPRKLLFTSVTPDLLFLDISQWLQLSCFLSSVRDFSSPISCHKYLTPVSCHQSLTPVLLILVISIWLQLSCFLSSVFDSSFLSSIFDSSSLDSCHQCFDSSSLVSCDQYGWPQCLVITVSRRCCSRISSGLSTQPSKYVPHFRRPLLQAGRSVVIVTSLHTINNINSY